MMCLAGGSGLEQAIADADSAMPLEGLPVASKRAGGESRRTGLKRKVLRNVLFCALIDSTDENYKIPKPGKNAWVLKSTSGTGRKIAGNV
jgi:hypothetical protein